MMVPNSSIISRSWILYRLPQRLSSPDNLNDILLSTGRYKIIENLMRGNHSCRLQHLKIGRLPDFQGHLCHQAKRRRTAAGCQLKQGRRIQLAGKPLPGKGHLIPDRKTVATGQAVRPKSQLNTGAVQFASGGPTDLEPGIGTWTEDQMHAPLCE